MKDLSSLFKMSVEQKRVFNTFMNENYPEIKAGSFEHYLWYQHFLGLDDFLPIETQKKIWDAMEIVIKEKASNR